MSGLLLLNLPTASDLLSLHFNLVLNMSSFFSLNFNIFETVFDIASEKPEKAFEA